MNAVRSPAPATTTRLTTRGTAFVETLVAVPIVLLLGLGALQWALLLHARTAVEYALLEVARAGSVAQARPDAIEAGLARGLMPFWFGVDASRPWAAAMSASNAQLRRASPQAGYRGVSGLPRWRASATGANRRAMQPAIR